ncbi:MAG: nucleotide exchange factor GrpE, partial [Planctomycetes bacterium]|nr:nucleotide exchange factor GrpE [Planctomycetota bacterium]
PPKAPRDGFVEVAEEELRALQEKAGERDQLRDKYLRAKADFVNLQNRIERERQAWSETALRVFFMKLVPVLDDLDRALNASSDGPDSDGLAQGFRMVADSLYRALAQCGIEPIQAKGQRFDPALHEAMYQEETNEHPDQTVLDELQRGFTLNGQVIRPAKVKVSRRKSTA